MTITTETHVGPRDTALHNEIVRVLVGSGVHGVAIEGTDDRDEMGVFIEPAECVIGAGGRVDHYVYRTQPQGARSGPGDLDLTLYSLRKFMGLALQGNPSIIVLFYTAGDDLLMSTPLGEELIELRDAIMSRRAGYRFAGYLAGQRERLVGGGKRNRVPNRPELIAAHGYDTKYASHALRLGLQGVELLTTGRLSLPMLPEDREFVLAMKRGEFTYEESVAFIDITAAKLERLLPHTSASPLRLEPDMSAVNAWMIDAHLRHWKEAR